MEGTLSAERHLAGFVDIGMPRGCQHLNIFQKKRKAQGCTQLKKLEGRVLVLRISDVGTFNALAWVKCCPGSAVMCTQNST